MTRCVGGSSVIFEAPASSAMPRQPVDSARVTAFVEALSGWTSATTTLYLVGGATAVTVGWRASTDIDFVLRPEDEAALRAILRMKEGLVVALAETRA